MAQQYSFDAEIDKLLQLVIDSIYTNKDIFVRELVSNASDASDKLRYQAISSPDLISRDHEFTIDIKIGKDDDTLTFRDYGIGMDKDDLVNSLGRIASSGTQKFSKALRGSTDGQASVPELIGQFGVGFYSCFMVSKSVDVFTRKAGTDNVHKWSSEGVSSFTIEDCTDWEKDFAPGTKIVLHLKDDEESRSYLDKFRLEDVVKTYSNHISIPIKLEHEDELISVVNKTNAIWLSPPNSVEKEEYVEFYKSLSWMADEPFLIMHNKIEGATEFSSLLFVPSKKPFDLYSPDRKSNIKLYVRRVFITDNNTNLLPEYLRFVRGVVDSPDLPLNISRETFQNNLIVQKIGRSIVKKILAELKKKMMDAPVEYDEFWKVFGNVLKEGLCRPDDARDRILEVCRFHSSKVGGFTTLDEYLSRMMPNQSSIYYLTSESYEEAISNPQLEAFKKKDIEVLLLTDTTDDFWTNVVTSYEEKSIVSILAADEEMDQKIDSIETRDDKDGKSDEDRSVDGLSAQEMDKVVQCFNSVLLDKIESVKVSHKLVGSPVCLSQKSGGMSIRMEKYLVEQKQLDRISKKVLEVNPSHPIIKNIYEEIRNFSSESGYPDAVVDNITLLFDCACLSQDEPIKGKNQFAKLVFDLIQGRSA